MNRIIWLPATEAKCIASACRGGPCARRDVSSSGRDLNDFSVGVWGNAPQCQAPGWLKRILPSQAVKPADKPVIKEWVGR